ncbi:MAG: hypothetical protein WBX14_14035 [Candidatus Udaeobacter sp.]|jgi:hypothetical protein
MKSEFRRALAQLPFEEKIRKVGELIRLAKAARKSKPIGSVQDTASRVHEDIQEWAKTSKR